MTDVEASAAKGPDESEVVVEPPRRRRWILVLAGLVGLAASGLLAWRWWESGKLATTDDAFVGGDTVPVLSRVNGHVQSVEVRENDRVEKGEVLVVVDPSELGERLRQAEAELAVARSAAGGEHGGGSARAQAVAAREAAAAAHSEIDEVEARAQQTSSDVERLRPLAAEQIVSRQQFDAALAAERAATAQLASVRQRARAADAQAMAAVALVGGAEGRVAAAEAAVAQARLQLGYARIVSPGNGVVAKKSVEVGQLVSPGQPLMTVVLSGLWIDANLKETQLDGVNPGDAARIEVDAYPGRAFHGHVESISPATGARFSLLPPENATGNFVKVVQRVPVRIFLDTDNPGPELRPGMSCVVTIRKRE